MTRHLGNTNNSRTPEQLEHMQNTVGKGICPFCPPDPKKHAIIRKGAHWNMWHNPFPYPRHQKHIVLATKVHLTSVHDLVGSPSHELFRHIAWAQKEFDLPGGAVVLRFGDNKYNAGTIEHLHAHIQVPDGTGPAFAVFSKLDPAHRDLQLAELAKAFTRKE